MDRATSQKIGSVVKIGVLGHHTMYPPINNRLRSDKIGRQGKLAVSTNANSCAVFHVEVDVDDSQVAIGAMEERTLSKRMEGVVKKSVSAISLSFQAQLL